MKLAIPTTQNNQVDSHFGHCEFFTVFTIEGNEVNNSEIIESPEGCGCKSNIAAILKDMGVEVMLAGNMGGGAVNVLNSYGIEVYRGCSGDINDLVQEFVKGELADSGETCHKHEDGHQCEHNN
jgi:predicted Fe-Mo cluster-binding NifX family protein